MTIYVLNAPIITAWGEYKFSPISVEDARELLAGGFESAVGHVATAEALTKLLGIEVPANRLQIAMETGDKALVFKLKKRLPEGVVINSVEELEEIGYDLGLLERVA